MIRLQNLTKRFGGTVAVDGLTVDIPSGEVTGFLGPNGAGKSTTLRLILTYHAPGVSAVVLVAWIVVFGLAALTRLERRDV